MNPPNISTSTSLPNFPISPEVFWAEFATALRQQWHKDKIDILWWNQSKRTEFLTTALKNLGKEKFGCHCDCEYWPRVDVSYFDRRADDDWNEWSWEAAIELENSDSWIEEVCKLIQINAGIKVLIAYVEGRQKLDEFFRKLPAIYQSRKYAPKHCNWLFIFGVFGEVDWDFIAFKFDGEKPTEITGTHQIRSAGKQGLTA